MSNDDEHVPVGRLRRLARVAAMGPRASLALARDVLDRQTGAADPGERFGEVLYETLGKLKGGSLKAGQLLAQVSDALPEPARVRLGRLFSSAPTLAWPSVAAVIEAELGAPPEALFLDIETEPFAAASLGQVHHARLPDGTKVAVKVQYPGVADALAHDLELLKGIAGTVTGGGILFDVHAYFEALQDDTLAELDYRLEAGWQRRMAEVAARWPDLVVPRYFESHSAERVLTSELLEGPTLHATFELPLSTKVRQELGLRVVRAVLGPLWTGGLINADAHPGNFLVLDGERLGLLDFGAVTEVDASLVRNVGALVQALVDPAGSDLVARLDAAGLRMRGVDRAVLLELAELMATPLRGTTDFVTDATMERLARFKQQHPMAMLRVDMDPHLLPMLRALVGAYHALKRLEVSVDVGALLLELIAVHDADEAP